MDFTLEKYSALISALRRAGYNFVTYADFASSRHASACPAEAGMEQSGIGRPGAAGSLWGRAPSEGASASARTVVLRHDVDLHPERAMKMAMVEAGLGVCATYYFRAVPESWDEDIIRAISSLGHEVGYHYESLTTCRGDVDAAFEDFCANLARLSDLAPVYTVCMHGSPRSPWDSRDLWKKYDYRELGILAEPYLDTDWESTFYLTDTGRRWDGFKVSLRDRIPQMQEEWTSADLVFHSTDDLLRACNRMSGQAAPAPTPAVASVIAPAFPPRIMITTHPQRWIPFGISWMSELLLQNVKNIVKQFKIRNKSCEWF